MSVTVIGLILLFLPCILMVRIKNKKIAFIYALSFILITQLSIAIITQALGIFNYTLSLILTGVIAGISVVIFLKDKLWQRIHTIRIDWALVTVIVFASMYLYNVHYNYSGRYTILTTPEYQVAENLKYPYPYYSDEWYAIAFIENIIETKHLPLKNPLVGGEGTFINFELAFHSFISGIMTLLGIDPLTGYTKISIALNALIVLLLYLLLRLNGVKDIMAATAALASLFITNGANLPGMWNLIPVTLGVISLFTTYALITASKVSMSLAMFLLTLIFYPPLILFLIPLFIVVWLPKMHNHLVDAFSIASLTGLMFLGIYGLSIDPTNTLSGVALVINALTIIFLITSTWFMQISGRLRKFTYLFTFVIFSLNIYWLVAHLQETGLMLRYVMDTVYYPTFTADAIPRYALWHVIPFPVLIFVFVGLPLLYRKHMWLLLTLLVGLLFWVSYTVSTMRLIIEYQRVIYVTSLLFIIAFGFSIQRGVPAIHRLYTSLRLPLRRYAMFTILFLLLLILPSYTQRSAWKQLILKDITTGDVYVPAAPANVYLHEDDIHIFSSIQDKNFLSVPWKGTVIGVATDNFPLSTKPGTITINKDLGADFIRAGCEEKYTLAKNLQLSYVYFPPFDCEHFARGAQSAEGFVLYQVQ